MSCLHLIAWIATFCCMSAFAAAGNCQEERDALQQNYAGRVGGFLPACDPANLAVYRPRQCLGSRCYCASSEGTKLTEYSQFHIATKSNCECAREEDEFRKTGMVGQMFDCASDGSFRPKRCVGSRCFCVHQNGSRIAEYTETNIWESSRCACARAKADYQELGIVGLIFSCESDGSFAPTQCTGSVCRCVTRDGQAIPEFETFHIASYSDCACARARAEVGDIGKSALNCAPDGSFIQ